MTDGDWAASPEAAAALGASADALTAERRAAASVLVYAPSTLAFAAGVEYDV